MSNRHVLIAIDRIANQLNSLLEKLKTDDDLDYAGQRLFVAVDGSKFDRREARRLAHRAQGMQLMQARAEPIVRLIAQEVKTLAVSIGDGLPELSESDEATLARAEEQALREVRPGPAIVEADMVEIIIEAATGPRVVRVALNELTTDQGTGHDLIPCFDDRGNEVERVLRDSARLLAGIEPNESAALRAEAEDELAGEMDQTHDLDSGRPVVMATFGDVEVMCSLIVEQRINDPDNPASGFDSRATISPIAGDDLVEQYAATGELMDIPIRVLADGQRMLIVDATIIPAARELDASRLWIRGELKPVPQSIEFVLGSLGGVPSVWRGDSEGRGTLSLRDLMTPQIIREWEPVVREVSMNDDDRPWFTGDCGRKWEITPGVIDMQPGQPANWKIHGTIRLLAPEQVRGADEFAAGPGVLWGFHVDVKPAEDRWTITRSDSDDRVKEWDQELESRVWSEDLIPGNTIAVKMDHGVEVFTVEVVGSHYITASHSPSVASATEEASDSSPDPTESAPAAQRYTGKSLDQQLKELTPADGWKEGELDRFREWLLEYDRLMDERANWGRGSYTAETGVSHYLDMFLDGDSASDSVDEDLSNWSD